MITIWHNTKNDLLIANPTNFNTKLVISQDRCSTNNSKQFAYLNNFKNYIQFLENNKNQFFYEVLYEDQNTPVYMYFDLDRTLDINTDIDIIENYITYSEKLITKILQKIQEFINQYYTPQNINFIIGNNIQTLYTLLNYENNPKLSIHLKINIIMENVLQMKKFTFNFNNFLLSNKYTNDEDRSMFFYYKTNSKNETCYVSVIDDAVYTKFRSFRLPYSSKISKNLPLTPFMNSSVFIKDHLINIHTENPQEIININFNNEDLLIDANFDYQNKSLSKPKNTKPLKETNINGIIQNNTLTEIQNLLENNEDINTIIKCKPVFKHNIFITESIYRFCLDSAINNYCPYAEKIHSNNRSYFDYCKNYNIIQYGCFNKNCKQSPKLISFSVNDSFDALSKLNEIYIKNTLHCKYNLIKWDENYNNYEMNNYPLKPLVAIGANMGVGKTNELIYQFIKKNCKKPNIKCLFITYQILLSKKYSQELEKYGFINYLDRKDKHYIIDNKIIICLDSLWKVDTLNFDYIFIDEAMSVLLHFNSPLIKDINTLSLKFELLLLQANHIYLLDTCIDNTIVFNMVKYLESKKNINCYWIKNNYIRDTNRNAQIYINKNTNYRNALEITAIQYIIKALKENKNIVVSSSTKIFTELLKSKIDKECPDIKTMIYNSGTDINIIQNDSINPNEIWSQYNCLIYSPTISAGISFTNNHFDEIVCLCENSLYTPPVDNTLQQMFRVRQLKNGKMTIFINETKNINYTDYPITEEQIDNWLQQHTTDICSYFPKESLSITKSVNVKLENNIIMFDTKCLSYQNLKSILYNKNKSLHYFSLIVANTLKQDYNINCCVSRFDPDKDKIDYANEIMKEYKTSNKKNTEFDKEYLISQDNFILLENKQKNNTLTELEKQQKYTYEIAINIWNLPNINNVNKEFFKEFIGHYSQNQKILDKYFQMLRFDDLNYTIDENKETYKKKIQSLVVDNEEDYNFKLLRVNKKKYYEKLIEAQNLLNFINKDRLKEQKREDFNNNATKYIDSLTNTEYEKIKKLFNLDHHKNHNNKTEIYNNKSKLLISKSILNDTFNIEINYNENYKKKLFYNFNNWKNIKDKYNINNGNSELSGYLFKNYE
jgi:hypothetical protein